MSRLGRTSTAELEIAPHIVEQSRPDAPYDLTDAEAAEWRAIVASMPSTHFARGNYPLLAQLCRHIVSAREVAKLREQCAKAKQIDKQDYKWLTSLQERETQTIMALCRSMRLSQVSIYRADAKAIRPLNGQSANGAIKSPWEPEDDE